jgi:hypothetical protein
MDVETELSKLLQQAIDKEVIIQARVATYVAQDWHLVVCSAPIEDIGGWMQTNIQDEWHVFFSDWLFKDSADAVLFRLTWG